MPREKSAMDRALRTYRNKEKRRWGKMERGAGFLLAMEQGEDEPGERRWTFWAPWLEQRGPCLWSREGARLRHGQ